MRQRRADGGRPASAAQSARMLTGLSMQAIALLMAAGVLLDLLLGEARRVHPLVGFGNLASGLERALNRREYRFARGLLAWLLAVQATAFNPWAGGAIHAALLYFSLGLRSLREHNLPIAGALAALDLPAARWLTSRIVSRDLAHASETELTAASAESLLEND